MLPLVTDHRIETVHADGLHVLEIAIERQVVFVDLLIAIATVIVVRVGLGIHVGGLLTGREVHTAIGVETQVGEEVKFVIHLDVSDERLRFGAVVLHLQQGDGVSRGQRVVGQQPGGVVERLSVVRPLEEASEILLIGLARVAHRVGGIHLRGRTYGAYVGEATFGIHPFEVTVHLEHAAQKRRREVQRGRVTVEARGLEDTVLVRVAHGHAERHRPEASEDTHVVIRREGRAIDLLLPVGVGRAEGLIGVALLAVLAADACAIGVSVHHVERVLDVTHRHVAVVRHAEACLTALYGALLGGDNDDTVRGA